MASSNSLKKPPPFDSEVDDYLSWKNDLEMWEAFTEVEDKKRGPAVYLSLQGQARESVRDLKVADINVDGGLKKVLDRLDAVYLKDKNTRAYHSFQKFHDHKRGPGETFQQFIVPYERLYADTLKYNMVLPEGVRAFFLLRAVNLPKEKESLAFATVGELDYETMKKQVSKVATDPTASVEETDALPVKEDCFYGQSGGKRVGKSASGKSASWKPASADTKKKVPWTKPRCFVCNSDEHLIADCPERTTPKQKPQVKEIDQINITLFSKSDKQMRLLHECFGKALLDSGCTKSVSGKVWFGEFMDTLSADDKRQVVSEDSESVYRFGDGKEHQSVKVFHIPVLIAGKKYWIKVEIIDAVIPLLLGKNEMKILDMRIKFSTDQLFVGDHDVINLKCSNSGHYLLPVNYFQADDERIMLNILDLSTLDKNEKMKKALKLHRTFGHATEDNLNRLIKNSKLKDKEFSECIKTVCENCDTCAKYGGTPIKPAVSLPLASKFNELVCLDLKEVTSLAKGKMWILHAIDALSKYSAARIVKTKKPEEIVSKMFEMWVGYFGNPKKIMTDNGGEFGNDVLTEMNEKLGSETQTSAAYSPFSNGIVE